MAGPTERNITLFAQVKNCVENGQLDVLQQLAEQEGLVNLQYVDFSNRILHFACQDFNRKLSPALIQAKQRMIEWLVENGAADPDVQLQSGLQTPLHKAVAGRNQDVVIYLLNSGFQANQKDIHGRTPLFIAAINVVENPDRHSKGMLQTLLQNHYINPLIQDDKYGTILHYAVKMKSTILAKEILKANIRLSQPAVAQDGVILREEAKSWMRNLVLAFDSSNRVASYYSEPFSSNKPMEKILMDGLMLAFSYDKLIPDPVPLNQQQEIVAPALLPAPGNMLGNGDQLLPDPASQNQLEEQKSTESDHQSSHQQFKLLQLMLWKNGHHLTGVKVKNPSPSDSALSRLTAAVILNGSLPDPPSEVEILNSLFKEFCAKGGPAALSSYLLTHEGEKERDEKMEGIAASSEMPSAKRRHPTPNPAASLNLISTSSIALLNILLGIHSFAQMALLDKRTALLLVRLALSVSGDATGNRLDEADATLWATLPFELFQRVLDAHPLDSPEGAQFRQLAVDTGAFQLLLACLAVFTEQATGATVTMNPLGLKFAIEYPSIQPSDGIGAEPANKKQKGSSKATEHSLEATAQSFDANEVKQRHPKLDELCMSLLRTIAAFIHESTPRANTILLPAGVKELIQSSYLVPAMCAVMQNDSMIDVAEHVRMLKAVFHLIRCMASCSEVSSLLVTPPPDGASSSGNQSIFSLLCKLRKDTQRVSTPGSGDEAEVPKGEMAEDLILTLTAIETANLSPAISLAESGGEELAGRMPMERHDYDGLNEGEGQ